MDNDIITCDKERLLPANLLSIPCSSSNKSDLIMIMTTSLTLNRCFKQIFFTHLVGIAIKFGFDLASSPSPSLLYHLRAPSASFCFLTR